MGFLDRWFGKTPAVPLGNKARPSAANGPAVIREAMLHEETAARTVSDLDEAVKALTNVYDRWRVSGQCDLVGGLNYVDGKRDACFTVNTYLCGQRKQDEILAKIAYHKEFPGDIFHRGSQEVLEWAMPAILTDVKPRGGAAP